MKRGRIISILLTLALLLTTISLAGCGDNDSENGPIKIGVISSQSGALEAWGTDEIRGFKLGIEYATNGTNKVLGRDIELLIEDDTTDAGVGVQKAVKLIEQENVDLLTGIISSGIALGVMEKAAAAKVPYLISSAASDAITGENFNEYTFRVGRSFRQGTMAGGSYISEQGETFYILAPDSVAGESYTNAWKKDIELNGGKVIGVTTPPADATDFTPFLQKVKDAKPDVLVLVIVGASYKAKLPQQIKELGLMDDMVVTADIADIEFLRGLGTVGEGLVGTIIYHYSLFDNDENNFLVRRFEEEYNTVPDLFASAGFTGGIAMIKALEKANSTDSEALVKAFEGLKFNSVKGEYIIRPEDHQTLQPMPVVELIMKDKEYAEPKLVKLVPIENTTPPITAPGRK